MTPEAFGGVAALIQTCKQNRECPPWHVVEYLYFDGLEEFPDTILPALLRLGRKRWEWRPTCAEVIALAEQIVAGPRMTVDQALIEINEKYRSWLVGTKPCWTRDRNGKREEGRMSLTADDEPEWTDPLIGRCIHAFGGWREWVYYAGPHANRRNHFMQLWKAMEQGDAASDIRELHLEHVAEVRALADAQRAEIEPPDPELMLASLVLWPVEERRQAHA